ncbi:MAG TPA: TonB-dependent receptor [Candidatus Binatia bacterium]|nr:TonB-dependent receptor [Candidatus Binatia bacterium]
MKTLFALLAALAAGTCCAQDSASELDTVVVTATRSPQAGNRLPAALTVITRQDLEASGAQSVADALRGVPGIQLTDFFGDGSQYATVDLRGFGLAAQANTAILVDGRRLNNVDLAPPDLSAIALADVERIEILQGSAGTLYGDQAVGGVINIVTREAASLAASGELGAGSYHGERGELRIGQRSGGLSWRFTATARGSDNYRRDNHHENEVAEARAGYEYRGGSAYVEGGYVADRIGLPGPLTRDEMGRDARQCEPLQCGNYSHAGTAFQRLNWSQALGADWRVETDFTRRRGNASTQLTSFGTRSRFTQARTQWSLNPRLSGRIGLPPGAALMTLGLDGLLSEYALTSSFGTQSDRQRQRDVYAQAIVPLARTLELTAGGRTARADDRLYDGFAFPEASPRHDTATAWEAGLAWKPMASLRLRARHDGNFRFVKADEYFSFSNLFPAPAPDQVGIRPQTGHTYELGADWGGRALDLSAGLYDLELKNEISFDPATFTNVNLERTRRQGATVDGGWQAASWLRLAAGGQYLRARFTSGPSDGKEVPLVARRTGKASATLFLPGAVSASLEAIGVGRRPHDGDFANGAGRLAGYAIANAAMQKRWRHFRAELRVDNLLDRRYADYGSLDFLGNPALFPSPDRHFWLNVGAFL